MHRDVVFPDFSAFQMTIAGAPEAPRAVETISEGDAAPGPAQRHSPVSRPGPGVTDRSTPPPFSWLGGDAWPNFPARPPALP